MSGRIEPEDMAAHDVEIEPVLTNRAGMGMWRASCSCGFLGPLRPFKRWARLDGERHQDRRAAGEA